MVHPRRTVPRRPAAAAAALALTLLALPGAAGAATLDTEQRCYVTGEQAWLSGSGFAPRGAITVTRGTEVVPSATADNSGAFRRTLLVPEVPDGLVETQVEVSATDGSATARTLLNIAKVSADFAPATGDLRTLQVSHVVSGFGLSETKPSIYLHYVSPAAQKTAAKTARTAGAGATLSASTKTGGSTVAAVDPPGVKTIRLGQLRGPCGVLRTSPRKLFPFKTTDGSWLLQYDTRPRYTRGTSSSGFLWVAKKVTITG